MDEPDRTVLLTLIFDALKNCKDVGLLDLILKLLLQK